MLASIGDLIDDIVVRLEEPMHPASDTRATITRRQGGSAATVAVVAVRLGRRSRFIGQVGDDAVGGALVEELAGQGVDTAHVRQAGSTGTIVVIVDDSGERSMLTDRRTCVELGDPDPCWLDDVTTLHVPLYSLTEPPLSTTAITTIDWARERRIPLSVDTSSTAIIESAGADAVHALLRRVEPAVVFANEAEAQALHIDGAVGAALTIVKRGPAPALVHQPGQGTVEVPARTSAVVTDSTGAGDAFAAGFLTYEGSGPAFLRDPSAACTAGHRAAVDFITTR